MNKKLFFDSIRASVFHGKLSQPQVEGLNYILDYYEKNYKDKMTLNQFAYLLASIYHETAHTFQPIKEIGGSRMPYAPAFGRGLIQITHDRNYRAFGAIPYDKALEWPAALDIAFRGCNDGMFTGRRLSDYINSKKCDFTNARRVVNGTDRAALIAGHARSFKTALEAAASAPAAEYDAVDEPKEKGFFDEISDFFNPPWAKSAPQTRTEQNPLHGEKTKIASAIVAALGALSVLDWNLIITNPKVGYTLIVGALITSVGHTYLPSFLWWLLPKGQEA